MTILKVIFISSSHTHWSIYCSVGFFLMAKLLSDDRTLNTLLLLNQSFVCFLARNYCTLRLATLKHVSIFHCVTACFVTNISKYIRFLVSYWDQPVHLPDANFLRAPRTAILPVRSKNSRTVRTLDPRHKPSWPPRSPETYFNSWKLKEVWTV